ncbi:MAG: Lyzozyme M1 (1,4-beta-N-acetylmuramidase) [Lachnospiraceae bacterium]|nr:Lyzozyme M1 (1,4-beta-N-acetylmuramidase) [Lachnospiraceae bacterium]
MNGETDKKSWQKGMLTGYACGLATAAAAALCIWAALGGLGLKARLHGHTIGMLHKTEAVKVKQGFPSLPERYSLVNDEGENVFVPVYKDVEKSAYDWDSLTVMNNYKYYAPDGTKQCKIGIDVSRYQSDIDWAKVKESGIQFVMIRAGYRGYGKSGKIMPDEMFEKHMQGAQAAGLDVGVYFFSQAINKKEAEEEADYVLQLIQDYKITYPVAFDSEKVENDQGRANELSVEERTEIVKAFLDKVEQSGYEPMVYANDRWFALNLDLRELTDYKLWLASYRDKPVFPYRMDVWQHTNSATVPGISGKIDMNIWFTE